MIHTVPILGIHFYPVIGEVAHDENGGRLDLLDKCISVETSLIELITHGETVNIPLVGLIAPTGARGKKHRKVLRITDMAVTWLRLDYLIKNVEPFKRKDLER